MRDMCVGEKVMDKLYIFISARNKKFILTQYIKWEAYLLIVCGTL